MPGKTGRARQLRCGGLAVAILWCLACWLAAPAAAADKTGPRLPGGLVPGAGESFEPPDADSTERKRLVIVGSSTMQTVTRAVIEHLARDYEIAEPHYDISGTGEGLRDFCAGIGPQFPDIAAASRRMSRFEYDRCMENQVVDAIEVQIGQGALVVVTGKGNPVFNMTPRMFYLALADQIPIGGRFVSNPYISWSETDKNGPVLPIHVILPDKDSGTRNFFNDRFMQGGCRHVKEIDAIYSAVDRVPLCVTLREGGVLTEVAEPFGDRAVRLVTGAPPGTVAIVGLALYLANADKLEIMPVNGVLPTVDNILDYDYEMSRTLRYYFKRAHMRNNSGQGVVRGIREFMAEITKESAFGDGGYFEALGIVVLRPRERQRQQSIVRRLERFSP
jgi:phosphate transport system substrate-binding protein